MNDSKTAMMRKILQDIADKHPIKVDFKKLDGFIEKLQLEAKIAALEDIDKYAQTRGQPEQYLYRKIQDLKKQLNDLEK